jgi:glycosyltransferase involved in cell wall biosynthesis
MSGARHPEASRAGKLLLLIGSLETGGAERQLANLALGLAGRGWPVTVASILPGASGPLAAELSAAGVDVRCLTGPSRWTRAAVLFSLVRLLRELRPGALIAFLYHANLLASLARLTRPRLVPVLINSVRNESFAGRHGQGSAVAGRRDLALRATRRLSNRIVANSSAVRDGLVARGIFRAETLRVIPNGIDIPGFDTAAGVKSAALRSELGIGEMDFLWLAAGRLEEQKDYGTLLAAAAQQARVLSELQGRSDRSRVLIAGEGRQRDVLGARVRELGLSDRVRFLGLRRDLPRLMRAADALVLSSMWEGLPNVILEALCASLPVVATDVGGVREMIVPGVNGLITPAAEPAALASAMDRIETLAPSERAAMGAAGRRLAEERFSLPRILDQWEALLRELGAAGG